MRYKINHYNKAPVFPLSVFNHDVSQYSDRLRIHFLWAITPRRGRRRDLRLVIRGPQLCRVVVRVDALEAPGVLRLAEKPVVREARSGLGKLWLPRVADGRAVLAAVVDLAAVSCGVPRAVVAVPVAGGSVGASGGSKDLGPDADEDDADCVGEDKSVVSILGKLVG